MTGSEGKGAANLILAGVQAKFMREIKPYQSYDVSSRTLTWDDEALWFVTWFVKPGVGRRLDNEGLTEKGLVRGMGEVLGDDRTRKSVFAILVSRYVVRAGRAKVRPVDLLRSAGLDVDGPEIAATQSQALEYLRGGML